MALLEIMNLDGTLAHDTGSPVSGGSFTITSTVSLTTKALAKGVYRGVLNFTFSGGSISGYDPNTVTGGGSISPSALYVKADGSLVIRVDDTGTMTVTGTIGGTPTPYPNPVPVIVNSAGQTKSKAQ